VRVPSSWERCFREQSAAELRVAFCQCALDPNCSSRQERLKFVGERATGRDKDDPHLIELGR